MRYFTPLMKDDSYTMTTKKREKAKSNKSLEHDDSAAVERLLAALDHPLKPVLKSIRAAILAADRKITEGIKWNSPSFYCAGWFATVNVRGKHGVLVVFHHGAKARSDSTLRETIKDPQALLQWHSADRASVGFLDAPDFADKRKPFVAIVKQWAKEQRALAKRA